MEQSKRKVSYSIVRYSPDQIKGEIINVGLLLYDYLDKKAKYFLLDEKAQKLKAILDNEVEENIYKTNKELLEYYLENSNKDLSGMVGDVCIASYYDEDFIEKYYDYFKNKELTFSEPNIAYTKNEERLFSTILKRYLGERNVDVEKTQTLTAKKYMKHIFENNTNLNKRIKSDIIIKPIKELEELEVKVDFTFKNGKWNYMQAIPKVLNNSKNTEWFSKIELMLKNDEIKKSKIHLLYKESDLKKDSAAYNLLNYLKNSHDNIDIHDIDKSNEVANLCNYIEREGQVLNQEAV
ncbi:MAG: DUF3037 domain-containing protein [Clostridium butyricum]|nr:DUF3037 domain-containing protein [Clostridium butyricum]